MNKNRNELKELTYRFRVRNDDRRSAAFVVVFHRAYIIECEREPERELRETQLGVRISGQGKREIMTLENVPFAG